MFGLLFNSCYLDDEEGDGRGAVGSKVQGDDGGTMSVKEVPHLDERGSKMQWSSGQDIVSVLGLHYEQFFRQQS